MHIPAALFNSSQQSTKRSQAMLTPGDTTARKTISAESSQHLWQPQPRPSTKRGSSMFAIVSFIAMSHKIGAPSCLESGIGNFHAFDTGLFD